MPGPTGITWLDWLIIPALIVLALGILWRPVRATVRLARWLYRQAKRVEHFLTTWFGGDDEPSMPERITRIEWHVGNGSPTPLHQRVEDTQTTLDAHLAWADEQAKALARLRQRREE